MTHRIKVITAALAIVLTSPAACSSPQDNPAPAPVTPADVPHTVAPSTQAAQVWKPGIYKVGEDIQVGSYKTPGDTGQCYWNRLKDDSGESSAIIARDIFSGPGRMTVKQGDAFVKFGGGCEWMPA